MRHNFIFIYILTRMADASLTQDYSLENVINKITKIDLAIQNQKMIRNKNKYNEIFFIKYHARNQCGHDIIYNICKKYLDAYCAYNNEKLKFYVATSQYPKDSKRYSNIDLFDYVQGVNQLYNQRDSLDTLKTNRNTEIQMCTFDQNIDLIKNKLAESQITLINNCLTEDEDFALLSENLMKNHDRFDEPFCYVVFNLKFVSYYEKKKWLEKHQFDSFFEKNDRFLRVGDHLEIYQREIMLPYDIVYDETKNYVFNHFRINTSTKASSMTNRNIYVELDDSIIEKPLSISYFHKFTIKKSWFLKENIYTFLKKYKNMDFCTKNLIDCKYFGKLTQFYIGKYVVNRYDMGIPNNFNLCEVFLDIFCCKDYECKGKITYSYIAELPNTEVPYMPFYSKKENKDKLKKQQEKIDAFLLRVNNFFTQNFLTYDDKKLNFDDILQE